MSQIVHQVHDKFRSFVGSDIGSLSSDVANFVASAGVAAKSIGIVHVNSSAQLLLSLGYRDDEAGYKVALEAKSLGHIDALEATGLDKLDLALTAAADGIEGIICHELVITASGDFIAVFLKHVA